MRNPPRLVALSLLALPAALLLSACGGDSASTSGTQAARNSGTNLPSMPVPQAATPDTGAPSNTAQPEAGDAPIQPSDYRPDPTYLPDDSHLGAVS